MRLNVLLMSFLSFVAMIGASAIRVVDMAVTAMIDLVADPEPFRYSGLVAVTGDDAVAMPRLSPSLLHSLRHEASVSRLSADRNC